MDEQTAQIVALLQREYLFRGLSPEQLAVLAGRFKRLRLDPNTIIFSQGSPADWFYIVMEGRVRVSRVGRDREERTLNLLSPGDFFGEEAFLFGRPRSATATAVERTVLLRLDPEQFRAVLEEYPHIRETLFATAESRRFARNLRLEWLGEDEIIYFLTRKHDFFLFLALLGPIFLGILSLPIIAFALTQSSNPTLFSAMAVIGAILFAGAILWGVWNWIDWGNDYYIVTNQRVIWRERVIGLYDSLSEAPLDTILAVNVTSSQLGRILNYGNINVRTFTGGIMMRNANRPYLFASFVEGYRERVIQISKEEEAKAMEEALGQALRRSVTTIEAHQPAPPPPAPALPPVPAQPARPAPKKQSLSLRERLENFLKVRYERNRVITYRKHWWLLVRKAWQPVLAMILDLLAGGILIWLKVSQGVSILSGPIEFLIGSLIFLGILVWLGYYYLDWINDIYRLTPEQIHDIEKRPLGREVKKTANLDSILSIEHERANILGVLLNFGTVTINVGETRFIFYGVYNPDQVHQDIADYREALLRRKRMTEATRERDRMVNWLVTFYNQTEKLEELENNSDGDEFSG